MATGTRDRQARPVLQTLEVRCAPSITPVGGEFPVNTYSTNYQQHQDVATDSAGDFVIAWSSNGQDGSGYGVYARRFDPAGQAVGGEFLVNTYTAGNQVVPRVAMDPAG